MSAIVLVLAAGLKKGAFFITLTKRLPSSHFKVLENELYTMSWGAGEPPLGRLAGICKA